MPQDATAHRLSFYKPEQIAKAIALIDDEAILHLAEGVYVAVSSNGQDRYTVVPTIDDCTCPAGRNMIRCYHLAAAIALEAADRELVEA